MDVTLACADGSTLDAHKVILSSVSTYFRDILKVKRELLLNNESRNKSQLMKCFHLIGSLKAVDLTRSLILLAVFSETQLLMI